MHSRVLFFSEPHAPVEVNGSLVCATCLCHADGGACAGRPTAVDEILGHAHAPSTWLAEASCAACGVAIPAGGRARSCRARHWLHAECVEGASRCACGLTLAAAAQKLAAPWFCCNRCGAFGEGKRGTLLATCPGFASVVGRTNLRRLQQGRHPTATGLRLLAGVAGGALRHPR